MIIKFTEVYENSRSTTRGIPANPHQRYFDARTVFVNPQHVVCVREEPNMARLINENQHSKGINPQANFTRIFLNRGQTGIDVVVEGTPSAVQEQLQGAPSGVLHG